MMRGRPQESEGIEMLRAAVAAIALPAVAGKRRGEACIGIRKNGSSRSKGFKWILLASKCVPKGKSISDEEAGRFISAASFRD